MGTFIETNFVLAPIHVHADDVRLSVDFSRADGDWDMRRFSLGQGGLQSDPMIEPHIKELRALKPRFIRLFVDEYYRIYPDHGKYDWTKLDREMRAIHATGAQAVMSLAMKPPALFPEVNHYLVHPSDYTEWERLIEALVRHCTQEKFDVALWEVGNEPDIGETGGTPYFFKSGKDYVKYYTHTVQAIRQADPGAKVGGPAVASPDSELVDALIEHCATNNVPFDFLSWHDYADSPVAHADLVTRQKEKLARFPQLKGVKTLVSEWNMHLLHPNLHPGYQPVFVIETTRRVAEAGLDFANYYHIRDCFVAKEDFDWMSPEGLEFMSHWWNTMPQYSALFDHHGRIRPAWYAFRLLSVFEGTRVEVQGEQGSIRAIAVINPPHQHVLVWRFGDQSPQKVKVLVDLEHVKGRRDTVRVVALDSSAPINNLKVLQVMSRDDAEKNAISLELDPWDVRWIEIE